MPLQAKTFASARPGFSLLFVVYLVAGAIVAATTTTWPIFTIKQIGSALLTTVLWPLILLGINLHIH
jgi:hypothetical protein